MTNQKPSILLVIVNFNQAQEIGGFLSTVVKYWPQEHTVVVDDGSSDDSLNIAMAAGFNCILHKTNQGVGAAIRSGILHARAKKYDSVLIMSSNGKMLPSEIPIVTEALLTKNADYVTGSRFLLGGSSPGLTNFRRISIPLFSAICTALLGRSFSDITCGFRCYKIDFLFDGTCDISQNWLSRYELEYYIHYWACRRKLRIAEVPVTIRYSHLEKSRQSKIKPITGWWSMMRPLIFLRLGIKR